MRSFTSLSSSILLMTTLALLALIEVRPTFAPQSSSSSSEDEIVTDAAINGATWRNEYEYVDLDNMSDEQLAEICTSRGFNLATETNDDSDDQIIIVHTHQYYVDAAWECLQMEADMMNETIQTLPEIIKDVQREDEHIDIGQDRESSLPDQVQHSQQYYEQQQQKQQYQDDFSTTTSNNTATTAIYNVKEITQEVIQQIKKDVTKIINFLTPSPEVQQMLREQQVKLRVFYKQHIIPTLKEEVIPALKSFAVVVKDWGMTVVDMTRRYIQATLMEKNGQRRHDGSDHDGDDDETPPNRNETTNNHQTREGKSLNSGV